MLTRGVIALSGPDGAGKSTQAERLAQRAAQDGRPVVVRWFRPGYSTRIEIVRRLVRRGGALPPAGPSEQRSRLLSRPTVAWTWLVVAGGDALIEYGWTARRVGRSGLVIYDRWWPDAELDLALMFPQFCRTRSILARLVRASAVKPAKHVLLSASPNRLANRRREEPGFDDGQFSTDRDVAYVVAAASGSWHVIDADDPPDVVERAILAACDG